MEEPSLGRKVPILISSHEVTDLPPVRGMNRQCGLPQHRLRNRSPQTDEHPRPKARVLEFHKERDGWKVRGDISVPPERHHVLVGKSRDLNRASMADSSCPR